MVQQTGQSLILLMPFLNQFVLVVCAGTACNLFSQKTGFCFVILIAGKIPGLLKNLLLLVLQETGTGQTLQFG
jgi:hypothetical protein